MQTTCPAYLSFPKQREGPHLGSSRQSMQSSVWVLLAPSQVRSCCDRWLCPCVPIHPWSHIPVCGESVQKRFSLLLMWIHLSVGTPVHNIPAPVNVHPNLVCAPLCSLPTLFAISGRSIVCMQQREVPAKRNKMGFHPSCDIIY